MSQNRKPPAYQEYAASIMANMDYRKMTLQDRGLFYTMRLECWVNERLPDKPGDLSKVLGLPAAEVEASLPAVMPFFEVVDSFIVSPELEDYRKYLEERRHKQSQGGKRGSAITNGKHKGTKKVVDTENSSTPSSNSQVPRRDGDESSVQNNPDQTNQNQSTKRAKTEDEFLDQYEKHEHEFEVNAYRKASRGG